MHLAYNVSQMYIVVLLATKHSLQPESCTSHLLHDSIKNSASLLLLMEMSFLYICSSYSLATYMDFIFVQPQLQLSHGSSVVVSSVHCIGLTASLDNNRGEDLSPIKRLSLSSDETFRWTAIVWLLQQWTCDCEDTVSDKHTHRNWERGRKRVRDHIIAIFVVIRYYSIPQTHDTYIPVSVILTHSWTK